VSIFKFLFYLKVEEEEEKDSLRLGTVFTITLVIFFLIPQAKLY
jgi:hypothetical protein